MDMAKQNLVIVESPAKAKTIGKYLGPGFEVKASMGHIRDLPKSTLGVDVATFEPEYQNIKDKADVIRELKKAAKARTGRYVEILEYGKSEGGFPMYAAVVSDSKESVDAFRKINEETVKENIEEIKRKISLGKTV